MVGEIRQIRVGDVQADLGLRAELVGDGPGDVFVRVDALTDDEDGTGAFVFPPAGAG